MERLFRFPEVSTEPTAPLFRSARWGLSPLPLSTSPPFNQIQEADKTMHKREYKTQRIESFRVRLLSFRAAARSIFLPQKR